MSFNSIKSHLRRINTPIEKCGKCSSKKTTWNKGYICPAETPEGQSVGVVKILVYQQLYPLIQVYYQLLNY